MSIINVWEYYENGGDFKEFVDKYARSHRTTPENCFEHVLVKETLAMYIKEGRA